MSINATKWVWESSKAVGNMKLVLLLIADCANHEGTHAFPSICFIAERVGIQERGVQKCIAKLKEMGELIVEYRLAEFGGNQTNLYTIPITNTLSDTVYSCTPRASTSAKEDESEDTSRPSAETDKPSLNHKENQKSGVSSEDKTEYYKLNIGELPKRLQQTHGFNELWERWYNFRKKKKRKPITQEAAEEQIKMLMDEQDPNACLKKSLMNQWQGLFPIKTLQEKVFVDTGPATPAHKPAVIEPERRGVVGITQA